VQPHAGKYSNKHRTQQNINAIFVLKTLAAARAEEMNNVTVEGNMK